MIQLQAPIKVMPSAFYSLVVEDANGVTHFWLPNGKYDGCDWSFAQPEWEPSDA